jgi:hypothetical protein
MAGNREKERAWAKNVIWMLELRMLFGNSIHEK